MGSKRSFALLICISLGALGGCSDTSHDSEGGPQDAQSWDIQQDTAGGGDTASPQDVAPPRDVAPPQDVAPPGEPGPLTFVLRNDSATGVYTDHGVHGMLCQYQNGWLRLSIDGEAIVPQGNCTLCECGMEDCVLCAVDCAPATGLELAAGDERRFVWDKDQWIYDQPAQCHAAAPTVGAALRVEFCWADQVDPATRAIASAYQCTTRTARITDGAQTVEVVID